MAATPKNKALYSRVKAEAKKKFKVCLAFRRSPRLHVTTAPNLTKKIQIFRFGFSAFFRPPSAVQS